MSENATSGSIFHPVVMFMFAVVAVVKLVEYSVTAFLYFSSLFVYPHEWLHLGTAYLLGVRAVDQDFTDDSYEIEFEPHSPEQGFLIKFAPLLLAPLAFLLLNFAFNTSYSYYVSVPVFVLGFGLATHALPSAIDSWGVFLDISRVSPISSIVSSVIAIPLSIVHLPTLLFGSSYAFFIQFAFAACLSYLAYSADVFILDIAVGVL